MKLCNCEVQNGATFLQKGPACFCLSTRDTPRHHPAAGATLRGSFLCLACPFSAAPSSSLTC